MLDKQGKSGYKSILTSVKKGHCLSYSRQIKMSQTQYFRVYLKELNHINMINIFLNNTLKIC